MFDLGLGSDPPFALGPVPGSATAPVLNSSARLYVHRLFVWVANGRGGHSLFFAGEGRLREVVFLAHARPRRQHAQVTHVFAKCILSMRSGRCRGGSRSESSGTARSLRAGPRQSSVCVRRLRRPESRLRRVHRLTDESAVFVTLVLGGSTKQARANVPQTRRLRSLPAEPLSSKVLCGF